MPCAPNGSHRNKPNQPTTSNNSDRCLANTQGENTDNCKESSKELKTLVLEIFVFYFQSKATDYKADTGVCFRKSVIDGCFAFPSVPVGNFRNSTATSFMHILHSRSPPNQRSVTYETEHCRWVQDNQGCIYFVFFLSYVCTRISYPCFSSHEGKVIFSLFHSVETGSGAHLVSYPIGTGGSFPVGTAARTWSRPLTFI
jgi:hypothetical protein